ncbi:HslU--HslV peptidase ATPase subunit [Caminibacter mediatlanticus]|uniref:ATP-dependent protease ATP-binding subunit n=1 Tax=Caminibacter mediatlanticus TB-2 TaxID=391592 RepID=A0AAI9AHU1_9BACT|nr:HslU--HslV peptidase ATPase subunit [Caminibacter mediatlanticus]EDM23908.1 ATP-dependent protease ATP-binding subunit [Caminibacter mediatlanticus TB-2]
MNMTPKEIVKYLDEYVVGQRDAKKTIAIALRNRYRRMQLPKEWQDDILPKNILMIGPTGVGKTEIARRMAKMMKVPFVKVEASKYTEVGFVGRDVESMIRDLVNNSYNLVRAEMEERSKSQIEEEIINEITRKLIPPLPKNAPEEKLKDYEKTFEKMKEKVKKGEVDHLKITIEVDETNQLDDNLPPEMIKAQESIVKIIGIFNKNKEKKEVTVKEAKELLRKQAAEKFINKDELKKEALKRAENGIIFIDEIDKIAATGNTRQDPSKEGVQRDLLPIVEGSTVNTKYGYVNTDHILFIAAGAFHVSKPSDLIPELQGRFPLRVELQSLDEEALYQILTRPKHSLIKQYQKLLEVEGVNLVFEESALKEIAKYAFLANEKTEDIGARRLHTVVEKVLEDINFNAEEYKDKDFIIDEGYVKSKLEDIVENEEISKYIL